jgi:16S rRNA (guanine1207-N2)-methyltransferase
MGAHRRETKAVKRKAEGAKRKGADTRKAAPWRPSVVQAELLGRNFHFETEPGLFCPDRVDEGTRLLLANLPSSSPRRVLDLGCGYGALGLPVAAAHPEAAVVLVDRDTLAVEMSRRNAASNGLTNATGLPSLGYRELEGEPPFDWVLCNVPARIGDAAVAYFLGEGAKRLAAGGELRVVVILDLCETVERLGREQGWPLRQVATGARHAVYSLPPAPSSSSSVTNHVSLYAWDEVEVLGRRMSRPADVSDEAGLREKGLPLLEELLPKAGKGAALVWRGGYGALALALATRGFRVTAGDRDLLATAFTQANAVRAGVAVPTRDAHLLSSALGPEERFDLVVGLMHPNVGEATLARDLQGAVEHLAGGGTALWLGRQRQGDGVLRRLKDTRAEVGATSLASRNGYTVWRTFLRKV